ncbi:hypothetical protein [Pasteurella atlantica]|uniref:hypothetical protein n=1 Tax=Pasteurellaceae TaxID=712 RepID=UPI002774BD4B|nr:hypothetical protein [Pasteurella atlantica]MDP8099639.1 hypothetical protein [Pasteurella atlantica]MDP8107560.1 hypothetical protein [Pasteurella atlantica]MDP8117255.1 hypothetical protein [Pasteurella atlantica]
MNKLYGCLRKLRNYFHKSPILVFIIISIIALSWISNTIEINKFTIIEDYLGSHPTIKLGIEYLSTLFTIIIGVVGFLEFLYIKLNIVDEDIKNKKFQKIEDTNTQLINSLGSKKTEVRQNCQIILKKIFEEFKLTEASRVTLFYTKNFSRNPEKFYILERYSTGGGKNNYHPNSEYLTSIGAIKYIWENGYHEDIGLCDQYPKKLNNNRKKGKRDRYCKYQLEQYQITEDMIKNMNMKSCDFVGKNLSNDMANVIILFESESSNTLTVIEKNRLNKFIESSFFVEYITSYVRLLNWLDSLDKDRVFDIRTGSSVDDLRNEFEEDKRNEKS